VNPAAGYTECNCLRMIVFDTIETTMSGRVCTLWLSREETRNAINGQMAGEILTCLDALAHDEGVRVLILRGKGKVFCAGGDLNWMLSREANKAVERPADLLSKLFYSLYYFPKPVIAYVHGFAMGGAMGLVACSDFVVAAEDAFFAFSEVKLGLVPATISPFVVKRIGEFRSRQLMLRGDRISAGEAKDAGLADLLVPALGSGDASGGNPMAESLLTELAGSLAANAPLAMQACKALVTKVASADITDDLLAFTSDLLTRISERPEAREGIRAFQEKRRPEWPEGNEIE
jgi:methylglutaconyl-CoA hydratase